MDEKIKSVFSGEVGIAAVLLFGSTVSGNARPWSDIDIAVLYEYEQNPGPLDLLRIREILSENLEKEVDIVCLNSASPILGMQVLKNYKEVMVPNRRLLNLYWIKLITAYADLKIVRRPMEQAILNRRMYG